MLGVTRAYFGSTDVGRMKKKYGKEEKTLGHRLDGGAAWDGSVQII